MGEHKRKKRTPPNPAEDPLLMAGVNLINRCASQSGHKPTGFQIRYSDDPLPVVWLALAEFTDGWETAAGHDPTEATLRLCEQLIDGTVCLHCGRAAGCVWDTVESMPLEETVCWYQYDPELETFRRGCE